MAVAKVTCLPVFDQAFVISDVHVGGEEGTQMFSAADRFAALVEELIRELTNLRKKKASGRTLLVINGDGRKSQISMPHVAHIAPFAQLQCDRPCTISSRR